MEAAAPSRDYAGVEQALFEMMEESLGRSAQQSLARRLGEGADEKALAPYDYTRTLADGYYVWGAHLLLIEAVVTAGLTLRAEHLQSDEAQGLAGLRRARNRFNAAHPGCPHCGRPLLDPENACALCGRSLE